MQLLLELPVLKIFISPLRDDVELQLFTKLHLYLITRRTKLLSLTVGMGGAGIFELRFESQQVVICCGIERDERYEYMKEPGQWVLLLREQRRSRQSGVRRVVRLLILRKLQIPKIPTATQKPMRSLFDQGDCQTRPQKGRLSDGRTYSSQSMRTLSGSQSILTRRSSNIANCENPLLPQGTKENYSEGFSSSYGPGTKYEKGIGVMAEKGESPFEAKCKGALRYDHQKLKNTPQQTRENHSDRFIPYRCTGKNLKNVFEAQTSQRNSNLITHHSSGSSSSQSSQNSDDSASEEQRAPRSPIDQYLRRNIQHQPESRTSDIFGNEFANTEQLMRHSVHVDNDYQSGSSHSSSFSSSYSNSSSSNCNQPNVSAVNYSSLLQSEILEGALPSSDQYNLSNMTDTSQPIFTKPKSVLIQGGLPGCSSWSRASAPLTTNQKIFKFKTELKNFQALESDKCFASPFMKFSAGDSPLIHGGLKASRKIQKMPFKVLDAPHLQDDFYLNLVDWSAANYLAVGLGPAVYIWSACNSRVTKLCELSHHDSITSVSWSQRGTHLSVGTSSGETQIWDAVHCKHVRTMLCHTGRVGATAWSGSTLATGSRDRNILLRDVRADSHYISKLVGHKQEVCGLKWSFDDNQLASGGNDNKLMVWSPSSTQHLAKFSQHSAAVKAIGWSPHQHGLLASGGGTADRCIRFWNTQTLEPISAIDTGSQVCNLMFSKTVNEIVSTHGYSLNQIIVWQYPTMQKIATLTGHTYRVLYLSMSPDGQSVVTGAGDETLRFWNMFPSMKDINSNGECGGMVSRESTLFPSTMDMR